MLANKDRNPPLADLPDESEGDAIDTTLPEDTPGVKDISDEEILLTDDPPEELAAGRDALIHPTESEHPDPCRTPGCTLPHGHAGAHSNQRIVAEGRPAKMQMGLC